jgi:hypothetical protein
MKVFSKDVILLYGVSCVRYDDVQTVSFLGPNLTHISFVTRTGVYVETTMPCVIETREREE